MDRDDLVARIGTYLQSGSTLDSEIVNWAEDVRQQIGGDLRSQHNLKSATVAMSSGTGTIPADLQEVLVFYEPDGARLEYASPDYAATWRDESGTPQFFTIDTVVRAYPKSDGNYTMHYFHTPAELDSGSAENSVLTNLPLAYLYAVLVQAYIHFAKPDLVTQFEALYNGVIRKENARFRKSRRTTDAVMQGAQGFAAAPVSGV